MDAGECNYTIQGNEYDATADDNCTVSELYYTLSGVTTGGGTISSTSLANVDLQLGTTTVLWTAVDTAGNTTTCSYTITVNDNQAPSFTLCPSNGTENMDAGECNYSIQGNEYDATATDNCSLVDL